MGKRMLRRRGLARKFDCHATTAWRRTKEPGFPSAYQIGPNSVGWDEDEVDAWLESRRRTRREAESAPTESIRATA